MAGRAKGAGLHLSRLSGQCGRLGFHRRGLHQDQGGARFDRCAGQQRRHHARPHVPQNDPRGVGPGDRDQPQQHVQRHQAGGGRHGGKRLGPHHQHQLGQWRKRPGGAVISASTYYRTLDIAENPEHRAKRDLHDLHHAEQIKRIWKESSGRYGVRKVWQQLKREGYVIARCTVVRLMKKLGIQGVWRGKNKYTTRSRDDQKRADDLVKRNFTADYPNQLWVGDFTYIQTHSGWVYTAFIIDVFSRAIVGWKVSTRMNTDMVLDALEQALHDRGMPKNVIHHSDRGVQYLSIRYTNRLEAANLRASVGTTGDSYDNALAETVNGLYKTEVIEYLKADWQGLADVQLATLNWVDWFNKKRVHSALGYVSPFEFEAMYYDKINPLGQVA